MAIAKFSPNRFVSPAFGRAFLAKLCDDRGAARRHFCDAGDGEIAVSGESESSGNGSSGENQRMREGHFTVSLFDPFQAQSSSLLDTEAMLLVD